MGTGGTGGNGVKTDGTRQGAVADSRGEEEEKEEEDGPELYNLKWKKDGKVTEEALIDDEVTLTCEVKNIDDGETVKLYIYEEGKTRDDAIEELEGEVKDGKVEAPWKVVYKGEEGSSTEEEIEEDGYTIPEYYFVAEYGGVESKEQSNPLHTKDWIRKQLTDDTTDEPLTNMEYTLILSDGTKIKGTTDENGYMEKTHSMRFVKEIKILPEDTEWVKK